MKNFADNIIECQCRFSDELNTRDLIHLYDFQKSIISKSIQRMCELVEAKNHDYLRKCKGNLDSWKMLSEKRQFSKNIHLHIDNF